MRCVFYASQAPNKIIDILPAPDNLIFPTLQTQD
jgi:hypothetical protein